MASKPLRPCRHPGCTELVTGGYCAKHQPRREPDRSAEAAEWHKLYLTDEWTKDLRPMQLLQEPFCRECAKKGLRVRATDVDHIVDHKGDLTIFRDRSNLESLCHSCHSRKTAHDLWQTRNKNRQR